MVPFVAISSTQAESFQEGFTSVVAEPSLEDGINFQLKSLEHKFNGIPVLKRTMLGTLWFSLEIGMS